MPASHQYEAANGQSNSAPQCLPRTNRLGTARRRGKTRLERAHVCNGPPHATQAKRSGRGDVYMNDCIEFRVAYCRRRPGQRLRERRRLGTGEECRLPTCPACDRADTPPNRPRKARQKFLPSRGKAIARAALGTSRLRSPSATPRRATTPAIAVALPQPRRFAFATCSCRPSPRTYSFRHTNSP